MEGEGASITTVTGEVATATVVGEEVATVTEEGVAIVTEEEVTTVTANEVITAVTGEVATTATVVGEGVATLTGEVVTTATVVGEEVATVTEEGVTTVTEEEAATVTEEEVATVTEEAAATVTEEEVTTVTSNEVITAVTGEEVTTVTPTVIGDLCILCCCSLTTSKPDKTEVERDGGDDAARSSQSDNIEVAEVGRPEFVRFCKELVEIQRGDGILGSEENATESLGGGGVVEDDEGGKMLSYFNGELQSQKNSGDGGDQQTEPQQPQPPACPDCLKIISEVSTKRGAVNEGEARLRKLQLEVVAQLNELQGKLGEYHGEMKRIEEVVKNSDTSCLESYLEGNGSFGDGGKAAVVTFRNWISTASTDLENFQDVAKRRLLIMSTRPFTPDNRRGLDKYQLRRKPKKKKIFNPLDFLAIEVKAEGRDTPTPVTPVKAEKKRKRSKDEGGEGGEGDQEECEEEYVQEEEDPYDYYLVDNGSEESSDWEDDVYDSDYCPSVGYQEEAMVEQQQFLNGLIEGEDPLQLAAAPPKKKRKKQWKKKRVTRDVSEEVRGLSEFKADVVKSIIRMQDKKERMRNKQLTADINRPIDYMVEDPGLYHDIQYDFSSGRISLGHVEIALDEETSSLICTGCTYSTHKLANSTYKYKLSEKIRHLFYHILGKHLEAFKCAVCGTVVTTPARYKDHIRGHQMQFVCDQCGKSVSSKGALQTHKWRFHMTEEEIQTALANGEKDPRVRLQRFMERQSQCLFQCATCGKKFGTKTQLKTHQETHLDKSERIQYICPQCGKSFTKGSWISHQQNTCRPEGSLTLYCGQCPPDNAKGFASKALLKRHVDRVHSDKFLVRPHPCPTCTKGFKTSGELKRHEVVHSDLRPFLCQHGCGASFKVRKHCSRHETTCKGNEGSWRGPRLSKNIKISNENNDTETTETTTIEIKPQLKLPDTLDIISFSC